MKALALNLVGIWTADGTGKVAQAECEILRDLGDCYEVELTDERILDRGLVLALDKSKVERSRDLVVVDVVKRATVSAWGVSRDAALSIAAELDAWAGTEGRFCATTLGRARRLGFQPMGA